MTLLGSTCPRTFEFHYVNRDKCKCIPSVPLQRQHRPSISNARSSLLPHIRLQRQIVIAFANKASKPTQVSEDGNDDDTNEDLHEFIVETKRADMMLDTLKAIYERGDLNLTPEYQRDYVWDKRMASNLIISVLRKLVIPPVLLHEQEDESFDALDGKQRLATLLCFMQGGNPAFPGAPSVLELDEDHPMQKLHGLSFRELPLDLQRRIRNFTMTADIIKKCTSLDAVFCQYEAINASAKPHSAHQIRRVAFRGDYMRLIERLSKPQSQPPPPTSSQQASRSSASRPDTTAMFRDLIKPTAAALEQQQDQELILRFFAMLRSYKRFRAPMKTFLNNELQQDCGGRKVVRALSKVEMEDLERKFRLTVEVAHRELRLHDLPVPGGPKALGSQPLSSETVYDMVLVGLCQVLEDRHWKVVDFRQPSDGIRSGLVKILSSPSWSKVNKTTAKNLTERIDMFKRMVEGEIQAAKAAAKPGQRNFSKIQIDQAWEAGKGGSPGR